MKDLTFKRVTPTGGRCAFGAKTGLTVLSDEGIRKPHRYDCDNVRGSLKGQTPTHL